MGAKKAAEDSEFISFILIKYLEMENKSQTELMTELRCSLEDFYKLALCKVPDTQAEDFSARLEKISNYTCIQVFQLNKIIKRVDSVIKLSSAQNNNTFLMAARDREKKKE